MIDLELFRQYLKQRKLTSVSIDSYMRDVEQFCGCVAARGIEDMDCVTKDDIRRYCDHMEERGLAPVSIQRKTASVKRYFEYLCGVGQARHNPVKGVRLNTKGGPRVKALTAQQMDKLLSVPDTRTMGGIRDKAMFTLINATGIKVSELIALRVEDLRLAEKTVDVSRQELTVTLEMDDEACRCLGAYIEARKTQQPSQNTPLFLNVYGEGITRQGVWKTLKKYAEAAGVEGITLETMRRSFARRCIEEGRDVRELKEILGHSDISITRAYIRE